VRNIVEGYRQGTGYRHDKRMGTEDQNTERIYMDDDGLVVNPAQSTWMDAAPKTVAVTPRSGKSVEINALWYANLRFLEFLEQGQGHAEAAADYRQLAEKVKRSFNEKFWNPEFQADAAGHPTNEATPLFDVIEGDPHGGALRPNMLIAVSQGLDLLSPERQAAVFYTAQKHLWTDFGPRSLSPLDSHYHGDYDTSQEPEIKDQAYHQGTVWPWLVGPYLDALLRVRAYEGKDPEAVQAEVLALLTPLV